MPRSRKKNKKEALSYEISNELQFLNDINLRRLSIKLLAFALIAGLNWFGLSAVHQTLAYFNDSERSADNAWQAGILDFELSSANDFLPSPADIEESAQRTISVINLGNNHKYTITATNFSADVCDYLNLEVRLNDGDILYSGLLKDFVDFGPTVFEDPADWDFVLSLIDQTPQGVLDQTCEFDFVFFGSQTRHDLPFGTGFTDTESIRNSISFAGASRIPFIINKVYYNVASSRGSDPENEWIELYNPNDVPIDISGWIIEDNHSQDIIPVSLPIPGKGFAVISANQSTWQYWKAIPADAVKIVLDGNTIGNGLEEAGDRVILKDSLGREVDAVSWGTDTYAFDPSAPAVAKGNMLARVPTGTDTNTAADWKELGPPQVNVTYPSNHGIVWYCGWTYNIRWTATNPNGPNSDLKITLLYIRDTDRNGVISDGDTVTTIAKNIPNTGSYSWKLSPCYLGYLWIEVIAVGPENFMVSGSGLSSRVYDPDPPEGEEEGMTCFYDEIGECLIDEDPVEDENQTEPQNEDSGNCGGSSGGGSDAPGQDEEGDIATDAEETEEIIEEMPAEEEDPTDVPDNDSSEEKAPAEDKSGQASDETGDTETANDTSGSDETATEE